MQDKLMAAINPSNVILLVISFPSTFSQRIVIIKYEKGEGNVINSSMGVLSLCWRKMDEKLDEKRTRFSRKTYQNM